MLKYSGGRGGIGGRARGGEGERPGRRGGEGGASS